VRACGQELRKGSGPWLLTAASPGLNLWRRPHLCIYFKDKPGGRIPAGVNLAARWSSNSTPRCAPEIRPMAGKLVLVAAYSMPIEAQVARGQLEAEGIQAVLMGDQTVNVFSGIQGVAGQIELHVPEQDAERAAAILAVHFRDRDEERDSPPMDDSALWVCSLCGDAMSEELSVCPSCETPRAEGRKSKAVTAVPRHKPNSADVQQERSPNPVKITSDTPLEAVPSAMEDDLDLPNMETFIGDDLVRRAFLTALFGPLFLPITLYSFWLLGRLALYPGKLSPQVTPKLYGALAINLLVFAGWVLFFGMLLYR
jgi:hypothetical protein